MQEMSYLQEPGFTVTSSRVDIAGQSFATRRIGSVKVIAPRRSLVGVSVAVVGLIAVALGAEGVGLCLALGGSLWALISFNVRKLSLVSDGGAVLTLESSDVAMVERVRSAIAKAMAST